MLSSSVLLQAQKFHRDKEEKKAKAILEKKEQASQKREQAAEEAFAVYCEKGYDLCQLNVASLKSILIHVLSQVNGGAMMKYNTKTKMMDKLIAFESEFGKTWYSYFDGFRN